MSFIRPLLWAGLGWAGLGWAGLGWAGKSVRAGTQRWQSGQA
ncbi:hypothetical protein LHK_00327 [Laribacter hongkongensis HLHK9]|uniref:Uncharacterized protein n=1 Tax=Laribacter hongkongensis (strain HLHK9) TaxID=557598 RepID=C1DBC5_LARHH|nr:hypothetical protein LHK_00327 [Laribacter hongkongensis HLHK9]